MVPHCLKWRQVFLLGPSSFASFAVASTVLFGKSPTTPNTRSRAGSATLEERCRYKTDLQG